MSEKAEAARRALSNALITGIAHDLNGRIGALIGVAHLARSSGSMADDLLDVLDDQIQRLRDSVQLLRAVPVASPPATGQPAPLRDVVSTALRLYRCRSGPVLASIHLAEDAATTMIGGSEFLVEALLLVLGALERGPAGATWPIRIDCLEDADGPRVRIERRGAEATVGEVALGGVRGEDFIAAAAARMEVAGGRLQRTAPNIFELLPSRA